MEEHRGADHLPAPGAQLRGHLIRFDADATQVGTGSDTV
jgi:hypothetical protein